MILYSKTNKLIEQLPHLHKKEALILLFLGIYLYGIIHSLHCLFEVKKSIFLLYKYIEAGPADIKRLKKVLSYYPVILKYNHQKKSMRYSNSNYENYDIANQHCYDLLSTRDFFIYDCKKALNPLTALKTIFETLNTFLISLGINHAFVRVSCVAAVIGWVAEAYMPELKSLLNFLISFLLHN